MIPNSCYQKGPRVSSATMLEFPLSMVTHYLIWCSVITPAKRPVLRIFQTHLCASFVLEKFIIFCLNTYCHCLNPPQIADICPRHHYLLKKIRLKWRPLIKFFAKYCKFLLHVLWFNTQFLILIKHALVHCDSWLLCYKNTGGELRNGVNGFLTSYATDFLRVS